LSLAVDPQTGRVHARVAARLAEQDGRRREYLDLLVMVGGTCRRCRGTVNDSLLARHPGVCARCFKRGLRPDPALLEKLQASQAVR
jgi:hypothetical protein